MKRVLILLFSVILCLCCLSCCSSAKDNADIVATTLPVFEITALLCENTDLTIRQLVTESVSCLHDYTLNPRQMKLAESAELLVISGAGFEEFMEDVLAASNSVADASAGIPLHSQEHDHAETHDHQNDPHIWLSPENGKQMADNIHAALCKAFPEYETTFHQNLLLVQAEFDAVTAYAQSQLSTLSCEKLITFHDGFGYMADAFGLTVARSIEEESGSEASARDLISICELIQSQEIPAVFVEKNGSDRAAAIVSRETGAKIYTLDTGLSGNSYIDALYHNINTLKEALE